MSVISSPTPVLAGLLLLATPALACPDREAAIAAMEARDLVGADALYERVAVDPACDDAFRTWLGRGLARETFRDALAASDPASQRALYTRSLSYAPHWRTYDALAGLSTAEGAHTDAARHLQQAINLLNEGPPEDSATEEEIAALVTRASQAMLLADEVVEIPKTRSGAPGGIFSPNIRGFAVEEVDIAIAFEFDSAIMTTRGEGYARQLLSYLMDDEPAIITLEGHTDPLGSDDYNKGLSLRRAEAVESFLKANGYTGLIQIVGKGETELPTPPEGVRVDSEDYNRIARRVVMVRG